MKLLTHFPIVVAALSTLCLACSVHAPSEPNLLESVRRHLQSRSVTPPMRTAIRNVRVFDGEKITPPQTVYIDNGTIVESHRFGSGPAVEVNGTGKYLIPGLIDSHLHADSIHLLNTLTSHGVTTAVNMAMYSYPLWTELKSISGLAEMFTCTVGVTSNDDPRRGPNGALYNMSTSLWWQPGESAAHFVDRQFFPGTPSTFMKMIMYPDTETEAPTQEQYDAVVNETRRLGYYTAIHASYLSSYEQAVKAKGDIIQHIASDLPLPQSLIKQIVGNGTHVTPTMTIFRVGTNSVVLQGYLDQNLHGEKGFNQVTSNVAALHKAGVPLLAGTDSAYVAKFNASVPFGIALHCELEFLVEAGLTPAEALRAGTLSAVEVQRLGNRGVISPGMRADLVLLNSNPLANISNTRDIGRVWAGGVEYANVTRNLSLRCRDINLIPYVK